MYVRQQLILRQAQSVDPVIAHPGKERDTRRGERLPRTTADRDSYSLTAAAMRIWCSTSARGECIESKASSERSKEMRRHRGFLARHTDRVGPAGQSTPITRAHIYNLIRTFGLREAVMAS